MGIDLALVVPGADVDGIVRLVREDLRIRLIPLPSEACAVAMADGYARRSGRPALVIAPGGPGAAALAPGAAQARGSGVPVLLVTGRGAIRQDELGWAVADTGLLSAAGAESLRVSTSTDLDGALERAGSMLTDGRTVHLILDGPAQSIDPEAQRTDASDVPTLRPQADPRDVVDPVPPSGRLALMVHAPALDEADRIRTLAHRWGVPIMTDMTARGVIPEDDPLALGHLGFGAAPAALLAAGPDPRWCAERIVALGAPALRASHRGVRTADGGPCIDGVPATQVARWVSTALSDARLTTGADGRAAWAAELARVAAQGREVPRRTGGRVHLDVVRDVADALGGVPVHTADAGGAHLAVVAGVVAGGPRTVLATDLLTGLGWGVRAALGAAIADPTTPVVAHLGDGALHVAGTDLAVAAQHRLHVLLVVHENGVLGSTRGRHRVGPRDPAVLPPLDPLTLADATGVPAERCPDADALRTGVRAFLRHGGPRLLVAPVHAPAPDDPPLASARRPTGIPFLDRT